MAVDNAYGTCIGFDTKREATEACRLARAYVKVHGDIDFSSFPYDLDQPLTYDLVDDIRRHWERDYPALDNQKKGHPNEYPHAHP